MNVAAPQAAEATGTFRALRGYNYRTWAAGALVSNVGTWVHNVAAAWLMTSLAPSPLLVALVTTITQSQRLGMSAIALFLMAGIALMLLVRPPPREA